MPHRSRHASDGCPPPPIPAEKRDLLVALYGLGEDVDRLAATHDVCPHWVYAVARQQQVVWGKHASDAFRQHLRSVKQLADALGPDGEYRVRQTLQTIDRVRAKNAHADGLPAPQPSGPRRTAALRQVFQKDAADAIASRGIDPLIIRGHLDIGRLPVHALLYTMAGIDTDELHRSDQEPPDLATLRSMAALRGFSV